MHARLALRSSVRGSGSDRNAADDDALLEALSAEPLGLEELVPLARSAFGDADALTRLMVWLAKAQSRA